MTVEDVLREIKVKVKETIPSDIQITDVEFEGPLLVIYTKHPQKFAEKEHLVRQLAKMLQKRITASLWASTGLSPGFTLPRPRSLGFGFSRQ